jgi:hydrogenase maturation protease
MSMTNESMAKGNKIRIIGLGNDYRRDDGIGLYVARKLKELNLSHATILEVSDVAGGLLDALNGTNSAIIVDAVSSGSVPGTTFCIDVHSQTIPSGVFRTSTHAMNVADVILLSKVLGNLPAYCWVYGIEGGEFGMGTTLSKAVQDAAEAVVKKIAGEVGVLVEYRTVEL